MFLEGESPTLKSILVACQNLKSVKIDALIYWFEIHNFQIREYFNSNLQQFIWIQFIFLDTTLLKKYFKGKSQCPVSHNHLQQYIWIQFFF